jgi:hypothetical protein
MLSAVMTTYMRSTITTPPARPLVHTNPEEGSGMRYHGPGCGGSPHDIEHRHFTWSGGARACDRERLAAVPIPDNQREYDIQHGLVDIVAHTMTITCGRLKRKDSSSVCFDAHQQVLVLKNSKAHRLADLTYWTDCLVLLQQGDVAFVNAMLEQLRTDGQWSASYAHWIGTLAPAAEYRS